MRKRGRPGPQKSRIRKPHSRKRRGSLAKLVKGITKKNRHAEVATGPPVGCEVW
jgi:antitoxin component of MazEF toxin-antitoxin module